MFEDRFEDARYQNDEPCRIRLEPDPRDGQSGVQEIRVAERLLSRLSCLAMAYELPLLSRLHAMEDWTYPEVQAVSLERELAFLMQHVSDPLLATILQPFATMLTEAIRDPRGRSFVVETPY